MQISILPEKNTLNEQLKELKKSKFAYNIEQTDSFFNNLQKNEKYKSSK